MAGVVLRVRDLLPTVLACSLSVPAIAFLVLLPGLSWHPHWPGWRTFALFVAVAPVLETLVFQGGLQEAIARRWNARFHMLTAANLLTAIVFASMHLLRHPSMWALATLPPALVFGFLYEHCDRRLAPTICTHTVYNFCFLVAITG